MPKIGGDPADIPLHLKNGLAHLHEPETLGANPLAAMVSKLPDVLSRGNQLRAVLLELIDSLKPDTSFSEHAPEWRPYLLLSERYLHRRSMSDIETKLALGDRQVRREHQRALNALGARLEARLSVVAGPLDMATAPTTVQAAVQRLSPMPRVFGIAALIEDVAALTVAVNSLSEGSVQCGVWPPDQTVYTDWGILHQLLLKLLKLFVPKTGGEAKIKIDVRHEATVGQVTITVAGDTLGNVFEGEDFQICRWIAESLHTSLGAISGDASSVQFGLPAGTRLRKVFIIDDEPQAIELVRGYLTGLDYEVRGETNPETAIESALEYRPDLIVLDVMMPAVDGWAMLQRLRHTSEMSDVPIVVYSVLDEAELAAILGATRFMQKPVLRQQWLTLLEELRGLLR